jgi:hypothetical protein
MRTKFNFEGALSFCVSFMLVALIVTKQLSLKTCTITLRMHWMKRTCLMSINWPMIDVILFVKKDINSV